MFIKLRLDHGLQANYATITIGFVRTALARQPGAPKFGNVDSVIDGSDPRNYGSASHKRTVTCGSAHRGGD